MLSFPGEIIELEMFLIVLSLEIALALFFLSKETYTLHGSFLDLYITLLPFFSFLFYSSCIVAEARSWF